MIEDSLAIVGNPEAVHVGAHFLEAGQTLGLKVNILDVRRAYDGPWWIAKANWWLNGRRPTRLGAFSAYVLEECTRLKPRWLLATGTAPLDRRALEGLAKLGIRLFSYLTDDPWNPALRAPWFMKLLPLYHQVFSTRRANLDDLRRHGCREVFYLPFAYSPMLHHPETLNDGERQEGADLIFAGGGDRDRVPYLAACIQGGFRVHLHGGYWERFPATRTQALGMLGPTELRQSVCSAKVSLCLVSALTATGM